MKMKLTSVTLGILLSCSISVRADNFSADELNRRAIERRAVEAVIWGMPAVNYDLMFQAMVRDAKGEPQPDRLLVAACSDWKNQTLTPNPDTIYLMPFFNTKDVGPMVLEIPPADEDGSITGSVDDCWQAAHRGCRAGRRGQGQGRQVSDPAAGLQGEGSRRLHRLPSGTYQGYALLRSNLKSGSDADIAKAVAYGKRVKLYPLSQAANPPATMFVDAIDVVFDANIPYDLRFFESLDRMVQSEPWLRRDMAMIDQLKSIGIEKGKPFNPDAKLQQTPKAGIAEAHAWMDNQYEAFYPPPLSILTVSGRCRPRKTFQGYGGAILRIPICILPIAVA